MIRVVVLLLAVAAPAAAWHYAADEERRTVGLTAPLFGWPRLLVAHLAVSLPLAIGLAGAIRFHGSSAVRLVVALVVTLAVAFGLPALASLMSDLEIGFLGHAAVRSLLALLATSAWLAVGSPPSIPAGRLPWIAAAVFLLAPPLLYALRLDDARAADFETFAKSGRLVRALAALDGLADLGSNRRFSGKSVSELRPMLKKDVARLESLAATPLPTDAPERAKLNRAMLLARLNRSDAAEELLTEIGSPTADVWMVRAALARERGRWADLEQACSEAIDEAGDSSALLEDAFDGLAEARRHLGRPDDAAATYRAAAQRLPDRAGYYELQLGLLAADRGRSEEALSHFAESVRLEPTLESAVAPHRRRVRMSSPSCLARGSLNP